MPTLTAPKSEERTINITMTMGQAFLISDMILEMDKDSFKYKQLNKLGCKLHKKAKEIND